MTFIFVVALSLLFGNAILFGKSSTIKWVGSLMIIGGIMKSLDLLQTFPAEAEEALASLPLHLQSSSNINEEYWAVWVRSVPNLAHDYLDSAASASFLGITLGCILIRFSSYIAPKTIDTSYGTDSQEESPWIEYNQLEFAGNSAKQQGQYEKAEQLYQQALDFAVKYHLGEEIKAHLDTKIHEIQTKLKQPESNER